MKKAPMTPTPDLLKRRTSTEEVFDSLHEDILSLKLRPGEKLSETEVAKRFGVSRQPVRDAFNRLGNLDLLLIRPQKATEVRGFSTEQIAHTRFIRLAIELEVIRRGCSVWDDERASALGKQLQTQERCIENGQIEKFLGLDFEFHQLICELSGVPLSVSTLRECKQKVDRLCMLALRTKDEADVLIEDHRRLASALAKRDVDLATAALREHLSRLDGTISKVQETHADSFE